jgi:hypothetical protein
VILFTKELDGLAVILLLDDTDTEGKAELEADALEEELPEADEDIEDEGLDRLLSEGKADADADEDADDDELAELLPVADELADTLSDADPETEAVALADAELDNVDWAEGVVTSKRRPELEGEALVLLLIEDDEEDEVVGLAEPDPEAEADDEADGL